MSELSYTDYFYADRYVCFTGSTVEDVEPFEHLMGEAQLDYQRMEIRWDGGTELQEFSVTKDGLAVLMMEHTVESEHEAWADKQLAELVDEWDAQEPRYEICRRQCNGPYERTEDGPREHHNADEDYVIWDGHEGFTPYQANYYEDLYEYDPSLILPDQIFMDEDGEIYNYEVMYGEPRRPLCTVSEEQPRSRFVDAMPDYIDQLLYALAKADPTITAEQAKKEEERREELKVEEKARDEVEFLYKARKRFWVLLVLSPIAWVYVQSAALRFEVEEPHFGYSFLVGIMIWTLWHLVLVALSFRDGSGRKNLRIVRRRLKQPAKRRKPQVTQPVWPSSSSTESRASTDSGFVFKKREADGEYVLTRGAKWAFWIGLVVILFALAAGS